MNTLNTILGILSVVGPVVTGAAVWLVKNRQTFQNLLEIAALVAAQAQNRERVDADRRSPEGSAVGKVSPQVAEEARKNAVSDALSAILLATDTLVSEELMTEKVEKAVETLK